MYSPGRPLPLCGTCDVVQVLNSSRRGPPLLPAGSRNIHRHSSERTCLSSHRTIQQSRCCLTTCKYHILCIISALCEGRIFFVLFIYLFCQDLQQPIKKSSTMIRHFPQITHPSGRSLSNRRLQSTTGPPVPIRSLDCRLTVATHGRQMHTLGLLDSRLQCKHRYFIKAQN